VHDPMTVAHEIKVPWRRHWPGSKDTYRPTLVTIWHVDPEKDGSDDSCDFSGTRRPLRPTERDLFNKLMQLETLVGNDPIYSEHKQEVTDLYGAVWRWRHDRPHRRLFAACWHVHHWRIVIEPLASFLRRFERCANCGERMGTATRYGSWGGDKVWHGHCDDSRVPPVPA
jgi:hypothetical protein